MAKSTPDREPLGTTLIRTIAIAIIGGGALALGYRAPAAWPIAALLVLWISLGGHWVEIAFLRGLRPRLPAAQIAQVAARVAFWSVGGIVLGLGMLATMQLFAFTRTMPTPPWWTVSALFVVVELIAHLVLALRGRPSFYNGRG